MSPLTCLVSLILFVDGPAPEAGGEVWAPPADVYETGTDLVIEMELPGTAPGDIQVVCYPPAALVQGMKGESVRGSLAGVERFLRVERAAGAFRRLVRFPRPVDRSRAQARLANGLLTVWFPKAPA